MHLAGWLRKTSGWTMTFVGPDYGVNGNEPDGVCQNCSPPDRNLGASELPGAIAVRPGCKAKARAFSSRFAHRAPKIFLTPFSRLMAFGCP